MTEIDELLTIPYEKNELEIGVSKFLSFINKYGGNVLENWGSTIFRVSPMDEIQRNGVFVSL